MRLGAVTHRGHAELIFDRFGQISGDFSRWATWCWEISSRSSPNLSASAPGWAFSASGRSSPSAARFVIVVAAIATGRYWTWERITMGLAIFNGLFVPAALLAHPDWHATGRALLTWKPLPTGSHYDILVLILADHRRHRHALDAFLPAERRRRQRHAAARRECGPLRYDARRDPRLHICRRRDFRDHPAVSSRNQRRRFSRGAIRRGSRALDRPSLARRSSRWEFSKRVSSPLSRSRLRPPTPLAKCCKRAQLESPDPRGLALLPHAAGLSLRGGGAGA